VSSPSLHLPTLLLNAGKVAKNTAYVDSSASNPGTYFVFLTALYVFRSQILFEEYMQCFSSVLACSICATRVAAIVFFNLRSMSAIKWLEITIHVEVLSLFCGLPCFYRVEWFCIRSEGVCRRLGSSALDMRFPSTPSTPPTCFVFSSAVYVVWSQILFAKYEHQFECVLNAPSETGLHWFLNQWRK
jgi:hypothetical protein